VERGFSVTIPTKTLTDLDMNVGKVADLVKKTEVDAWVVQSALSEVLAWFSEQEIPTFALYGRYTPGMKIAALTPGRERSMAALIRRLASLKHRRIVMLTASGGKPRYFTQAMEENGIPWGDYSIPSFERSPDGLRRCLDSLFAITPPTALIIDEVHIFHATQHELARRGISAPQQVSLACLDGSLHFKWYRPSVAHIHWEMKPVVRRIIAWASNVNRGKEDTKKLMSRSEFVDGETIGPAMNIHQSGSKNP
jgi:DNA-binding LacI/PurR family transcriptional regulator